MTPQEIRDILHGVIDNRIVADYWIVGLVVALSGVTTLITAYLSSKGKNLATKEDIGRITHEIESVKNLYAQEMERYKKELENRYKAEKVAELFARAFYEKEELRDFNRLNWELSLYLPKEIVCEISQKLVKERTPARAMEVLIMVREYFGIKDGLKWDNIAYSIPEKKEAEPSAGGNAAAPRASA